jgi:hypothetical protein
VGSVTDTQRAVLEALPLEGQRQGRTARQVAAAVWPDDPGWRRRTSGRSASSFNGALGATLPLRAGRVLSTLERAGLATRLEGSTRWCRTWEGHRATLERDAADGSPLTPPRP